MNRPFNRCGKYRRNASLLASGLLAPDERERVEGHLDVCANCKKYYESTRKISVSFIACHENAPRLEPTPAARLKWVKTLQAATKSSPPNKAIARDWLHELFWSYRYAWSSLAALWLMMWLVNWECPRISTVAGSAPRPSIIEAMHEQQQLLTELIPPANPQPAEPPRPRPAPRSERKTIWAAC